ncbi:MAG: recombinase family protein [Armatimonadota bacterium]
MNEQCVCYTRVSTEEQVREGVSLDAQEERLKGYCMMTGLTITAMIREEGVSGRTPLAHRPGGKELQHLIHGKQVQHIVGLKLDRLFRDAEDCLRQTREWDKAGITLHLLDLGGQAVNTSSAMGRMMLTMVSAFAELERNLIAERTASALQHKKQNRQAYSPTPFGYQRKGNVLIPDPQELTVITRIQTMHAEGTSLRHIAKTLNMEGIPSKRGGQWHASTLWYLLQNDLHYGK